MPFSPSLSVNRPLKISFQIPNVSSYRFLLNPGILTLVLRIVGGNPYPGIQIDETFVDKLKKGYRMDKPAYATDQV